MVKYSLAVSGPSAQKGHTMNKLYHVIMIIQYTLLLLHDDQIIYTVIPNIKDHRMVTLKITSNSSI